jgi:three-Cys-motif partner protein
MTKAKKDRYETDPSDGLRAEIVGEWSPEKHARLRRYVDITHATRRKYDRSGSAYIDLYCGPGRARIRDSDERVEGSALVASVESRRRSPFTSIHIADLDDTNVTACRTRLEALGMANIHAYTGTASDTAAAVARSLHPTGLHLAFLDPYSITQLPFCVIRALAGIKRMDLLIHVSVMDLQRNARLLLDNGAMDAFAPGWQNVVDRNVRNDLLVVGLFRHWRSLLENLDYRVSDNVERVTGSRNQPLYWLVLVSRSELADKFWAQVSNVERNVDCCRRGTCLPTRASNGPNGHGILSSVAQRSRQAASIATLK